MSNAWARMRDAAKNAAQSPVWLRGLALASVIGNVGIVVTGGAVRLTGSGLGCPTWPQCTDGSYTPTAAMGINSAIEFGNRTLTFVLAIIAIAGFIAARSQRPRRPRVVWLSVLAALGIPSQAVLGGITVLTKLNPWVVGLHFLASIAVITAAFAFWRSTMESDVRPVVNVKPPLWTLTRLTTLACVGVLIVGVMVTGSGPHAGDAKARRNGLDPQAIAQVHADLVFLVLGLAIALWLALQAVASPGYRQARLLVIVVLGQGLIGFVQYFTKLPVMLVGAHMLGACLVWLATLAVLWAVRVRPPAVPAQEPARAELVTSASS